MSSTNNRPAEIFFAELLLPLRYLKLRHGTAFLDRGQRRQSYWSEVSSRTGGMERLPKGAYDAAALLRLLEGYWTRRNEASLLKLLPHLERLRADLASGGPMEPQTTKRLLDFVYPLF
jgi:hypothetical protein